MSISARNRRVSVYAPITTLSVGVPVTTYLRRDPGVWWASLEPPTGRERMVGLTGDHVVSAILTLAAEATVRVNDAVVDDTDVIYEVRAILARHAEQQVWLETVHDAQATYTLAVS